MRPRVRLVASLLAIAVTVSGCESFDPQDWFNPKKPLPGDRKSVFPSGVPGVPQGVPPELVEGYRPPPEPEPPPPVEAKPKPKPKPALKRVAAPPRPAAPPPGPPRAAAPEAPWPSSSPPPSGGSSPFPEPPRR